MNDSEIPRIIEKLKTFGVDDTQIVEFLYYVSKGEDINEKEKEEDS